MKSDSKEDIREYSSPECNVLRITPPYQLCVISTLCEISQEGELEEWERNDYVW